MHKDLRGTTQMLTETRRCGWKWIENKDATTCLEPVTTTTTTVCGQYSATRLTSPVKNVAKLVHTVFVDYLLVELILADELYWLYFFVIHCIFLGFL